MLLKRRKLCVGRIEDVIFPTLHHVLKSMSRLVLQIGVARRDGDDFDCPTFQTDVPNLAKLIEGG